MEIHHVGIAVENLETAAQPYFSLGYALEAEETVESQGVKVWMLADRVSGARIELLQSAREGSAIGKFIEKRGRGCTISPSLRRTSGLHSSA